MIQFRVVSVCIMLMVLPSWLLACDVCGCGTVAGGVGLLSNYKGNFFRINYYDATYKTNNTGIPNIIDYFGAVDVAVQFKLSNKWRLSVSVPFRYNRRTTSEKPLHLKGIGDIQMQIQYVLLQKKWSKNQSFYLASGIHIQCPTGAYDPHLHRRDLPNTFNVGSGTFGLSAQIYSLYQFKEHLISVDVLTKYMFPHHNTIPGQKSLVGFQYHYRKDFNKHSIIPMIGCMGEYIQVDRYRSLADIHGTSGAGFFGQTGIQYSNEVIIVGIMYAVPIWQEYVKGESIILPKWSIHTSFIF